MTKHAPPPHERRVATIHFKGDPSIAPCRNALLDVVDGDWAGDARWMRKRYGIAARSAGRSIGIMPMVANHGLSRVEMTWREGRRIVGSLIMPCERAAFPCDFDDPVDDAAMLACTRSFARAALELLHEDSLVAPDGVDNMPLHAGEALMLSGDTVRHVDVLAALRTHAGLCGAAVAACGLYERTDTGNMPILRAEMPSPWRGTTLLDIGGLEASNVPDHVSDILDEAAAAIPNLCEVSSASLTGHRRFDVTLQPIGLRLEPVEPVEAMRRIGRVAA